MQALADVFAEDHAKALGIDRKYADWVLANVEDDGYGQCKEVTRQMAETFPELKRIRGHYYCWAWGERAHWWLADTNGTIIDPTAQQFPSKGKGEYVTVGGEWKKCSACNGKGGHTKVTSHGKGAAARMSRPKRGPKPKKPKKR